MLADSDTHPSIYLSRLSINGDSETLAWSGPHKARSYIDDRVPGGVDEWETELSDNVQVAVIDNSEITARLERVQVADPVAAADTFEKYPSPRRIIDADSLDNGD